ncbi:MAG TPA: TetR family transcriptional regulator [Janthinobacterium sp.]|nr:TetR family transcriptional regulator [Janthinobacterium sp.]
MALPVSFDIEPDQAATSANDADTSACKGAGRPRAADMEARLDNLLETAGQLFLKNGYSKVSLELIARQAHVAVRTIYVKFGGKAGLFNAVIVSHRARYFSTMVNMETDTRPLEDILGDFALRFMSLVSVPAAACLHRMVIAEAESNPELATTFYQVGPGQTRDLLVRFFARPDIAPRFRAELPHELLATHLLNCIMGDQLSRLLFPARTGPSEETIRNNVALGLDLFFKGTLR